MKKLAADQIRKNLRMIVIECARLPCRIGSRDFLVSPTFSSMMLNAVARAASGALRAVKPALAPQLLQNEAVKAVGALSANCKYIFIL